MPRGRPKGHRLSDETKERIRASVSAVRTGTSHSKETRERIAAGQRAAWARHYREEVETLRGLAAKARTEKQRRSFEEAAAKIERRLE